MTSATGILKVGIFGVGAIGQTMAGALDRGGMRAVLIALADQEREKAETFAGSLRSAPPVVSANELVARSDLIVEAAGQAALAEIVPKALEHGKDLLVMSVGGLLGHKEWFDRAQERGCRLYVPSGAIAHPFSAARRLASSLE